MGATQQVLHIQWPRVPGDLGSKAEGRLRWQEQRGPGAGKVFQVEEGGRAFRQRQEKLSKPTGRKGPGAPSMGHSRGWSSGAQSQHGRLAGDVSAT